MSREELHKWLQRDDEEFVATITKELTEHVASIDADKLTGYAVQVLDGADYRGQYLTVAWTTSKADDAYMKYCTEEWEESSDDALSQSQKLLVARHKTFASLHTKEDPSDFSMDDDQIANLAQLKNCVLAALRGIRDSKAISKSTFAVVWSPMSPTEVTARSVTELNSKAVAKEFLGEFED